MGCFSFSGKAAGQPGFLLRHRGSPGSRVRCAGYAEGAGAPAGAVPTRQLKGTPALRGGVRVGAQVTEDRAAREGAALLPHLFTRLPVIRHTSSLAPRPGSVPGPGSAPRSGAGAGSRRSSRAGRQRAARPRAGRRLSVLPQPPRGTARPGVPGGFTRGINSPKSHEIPWREGATRRGSGRKPTCRQLLSAGGAVVRGSSRATAPQAQRLLAPNGSSRPTAPQLRARPRGKPHHKRCWCGPQLYWRVRGVVASCAPLPWWGEARGWRCASFLHRLSAPNQDGIH